MIEERLLDALDTGRPWAADLRAALPTDLVDACRVALGVRERRIARGEKPVGYKIGFTNRTIWDRYKVFAPIWGTVWDTTLTTTDAQGTVDLSPTCQPRIEPEVVFGFASTPPDGASLEDLFACLDWIAPGFEVVQSHCPDWKFAAAETVADGGLHARLLIGKKHDLRAIAPTGTALDELLADTTLTLFHDDRRIDEGRGANVLDGPLHALHHFVRELAATPLRLRPADVVTTGTWTDAWPVAPGQTWRSAFDRLLPGLTVTFR